MTDLSDFKFIPGTRDYNALLMTQSQQLIQI